MKKLIAGLTGALFLAAGLVTVSGGTPANAACVQTKYNPAVCPTTSSPKPAGLGNKTSSAPKQAKGLTKTIKVSFGSAVSTKATVTITVTKSFGGKFKKIKSLTKHNVKKGHKVSLKTKKLKYWGTYVVTVTITPKGSSTKIVKVYYFKVKK